MASLESFVLDVESPSFQFSVTRGYGFLNRVLDIHGDWLFGLIRFLELPEVHILQ